ncbi:hypothetical protein Tco_0312610 [Tanacetum coccineum]
MKGKPKNLLKTDEPKVLDIITSTLYSKQHHVTSQCSAPLSLAIEQPVTLEPTGEITLSSLRRHSPLEGVPSQVADSASCGLKRNSLQLPNSGRNGVDRQPDLRAFERYSRLCAIDTTVLSRPTSFNIAVTNSVRNAESFSNDSPDTAFVLNENLSHDWDNVTLMPRSVGKKIILDFEQSVVPIGSVETQGESSGTGHEPCVIAHNGVFIDNIRNYRFQTYRFYPRWVTFKKAAHLLRELEIDACQNLPVPLVNTSVLVTLEETVTSSVIIVELHCLKGHSNSRRPEYHLCYGGGKFYMEPNPDPPKYIKRLIQNKHFMENIRAYNQMLAMTSFGVKIN